MKRFVWLALLLILLGPVSVVQAESALDAQSPSKPVDAAKAITKITGVAISPLLGMATVGAYEYFTTPKEKKNHLPWYANPYFWIPALLVVVIVAAKDAFGATLPPGVKKPLDVLETIENTISGLVATGAFVPIAAAIFGTFSPDKGTSSSLVHPVCLAGFATLHPGSLLNIFSIPLAMVVFVVVWLLGHVINVLILISPIGALDAALKSLRTFLMGLVALAAFVSPWLGAVFSVLIILVAYFLAGWSFRLTVFGSIYIWDFLTGGRIRFKAAPDANWMFTARRIEKVPIRTFGKLVRAENGTLRFEYRPLLAMGTPRRLELPGGEYAMGRGLFYPEIMLLQRERGRERTLLVMPPRYRTHEHDVARVYGITNVRDIGLLHGFKATLNWLKAFFGLGSRGETPASA